MPKAVGAASVAALLASAAAAAAEPPCSDREDAARMLAQRYGEVPLGVGLANDGNLLELLTSDGGETWTLLVHLPGSVSCLLATGTDWQILRWEVLACRDNPDCV